MIKANGRRGAARWTRPIISRIRVSQTVISSNVGARHKQEIIPREINLAIFDKAGCILGLLTGWEIILFLSSRYIILGTKNAKFEPLKTYIPVYSKSLDKGLSTRKPIEWQRLLSQ